MVSGRRSDGRRSPRGVSECAGRPIGSRWPPGALVALVLVVLTTVFASFAVAATNPTATGSAEKAATSSIDPFTLGAHPELWERAKAEGVMAPTPERAARRLPRKVSPTAGDVTGTVTAETSAAPLAGIRVTAVWDYYGTGLYYFALTTTQTAANGRYRLYNLPPGTYTLLFEDPTGAYAYEYKGGGAQVSGATTFTVTANAVRGGGDGTLGPAGILTGPVTDEVSGTAVAGMPIYVYRFDPFLGGWTYTWNGSTDASGLAIMRGLNSNAYRVQLLSTSTYAGEYSANQRTLGRATDRLVVKGGVTSWGENVARAGYLAGKVTDRSTGADIPTVSVNPYLAVPDDPIGAPDGWVNPGWSQTKQDGTFSIVGLPPGRYRLYFRHQPASAQTSTAYAPIHHVDAMGVEHATDVTVSSWATTTVDMAMTPFGPDVYESADDTMPGATFLPTDGSLQRHTMRHATTVVKDWDWMRFDARAGHRYLIQTHTWSDTYMYLTSTSGTATPLTYNDDGGIGLSSKITFDATLTGSLWVAIRHWNYTAGIGAYDISIKDLTDVTPPGPVGGLKATPGDRKVLLGWVNPPDTDLQRVRALRSTEEWAYDATPTATQVKVFDGVGTNANDSGLTNLRTYYYTVFVQDIAGNWSVKARTVSKPKPYARFSTPRLSTSRVRRNVAFAVSGALRPRRGGSTTLLFYRRYGSTWRLKKAVRATNRRASSSTAAYRAAVRLPWRGRWYVRAYYPGDSTLLPTYSPARVFWVR